MPDIEVTDEMIEAGETEAAKHSVRIDDANVYLPAPALAAIYRAMRAKERDRPVWLDEAVDLTPEMVERAFSLACPIVTLTSVDSQGNLNVRRIPPEEFYIAPQHDIPIPDA